MAPESPFEEAGKNRETKESATRPIIWVVVVASCFSVLCLLLLVAAGQLRSLSFLVGSSGALFVELASERGSDEGSAGGKVEGVERVLLLGEGCDCRRCCDIWAPSCGFANALWNQTSNNPRIIVSCKVDVAVACDVCGLIPFL